MIFSGCCPLSTVVPSVPFPPPAEVLSVRGAFQLLVAPWSLDRARTACDLETVWKRKDIDPAAHRGIMKQKRTQRGKARSDRIRVDPEFAALIPPLSAEERQRLELSLLEEGCRDPLIVWKDHDILLDGH